MKYYCAIADKNDPVVNHYKKIITAESQEDALNQYAVMSLNNYTAEQLPGPLIYISTWGHGDDIANSGIEAKDYPANHGYGIWIHHKLYGMELHEEAEIVRKTFWTIIENMRAGKTGCKRIDPPSN